MPDFIQPLELKSWMINVFSGTPEIFSTIALFVIASLSGFFRMNTLGLMIFITTFVLMFADYLTSDLFVLIGIIGGLVIGNVLRNLFR